MRGYFLTAVLTGLLWSSSAATAGDGGFHYDSETVRPATYYAALSNLASTAMFSGNGEKLIFSVYERDNWLRRVGFITRPPMPDVALVGPVYASGSPQYVDRPDFASPASLVWPDAGADRTLDPGAQAWTLLKITSPLFHLQFHDLRENQIVALMMIPQARALAKTLDRRLSDDGLFTSLTVDGAFAKPNALDQAAVLWASSSLIMAATSAQQDYWHQAFADLTNPDDSRPMVDRAFAALGLLPAQSPAARAVSIEALGRYAVIMDEETVKQQALALARLHADALLDDNGSSLQDVSLAIWGLVEAGRLLAEPRYGAAAIELFSSDLLPRWDDAAGVFLSPDGSATYSVQTVGAVVAALNAVRWYGPETQAGVAAELYPAFFENAIVRSGLLQSSPLALVSASYLQDQPAENFAHPALPDPATAGVAPVFAAEVTYENGGWSVTNPAFETGPAMFLANMLALRSDGQADTFLTDAQLKSIR